MSNNYVQRIQRIQRIQHIQHIQRIQRIQLVHLIQVIQCVQRILTYLKGISITFPLPSPNPLSKISHINGNGHFSKIHYKSPKKVLCITRDEVQIDF